MNSPFTLSFPFELLCEDWVFVVSDRDQMRLYALSLQPSDSARSLRTLDIWLLDPRHDVKRQNPTLFYRKRLCVIHFELLRGPVCFSSGRRNDQPVEGLSGASLDLLCTSLSGYCRSVKQGFITSGFTWKSSVFADISIRAKSNGDDGFIAPIRAVHVVNFIPSFGGNRVCLSLSRHHCAAAAHQLGAERQHWTTRYRVPYPTQVSTTGRGALSLQMFWKSSPDSVFRALHICWGILQRYPTVTFMFQSVHFSRFHITS